MFEIMGDFYGVLADLVLVLHLGFVAFVVAGGAAIARWPWLVRWHLPAAVWGAAVEFMGWPCPLTPLEQSLRRLAGEAGYHGDFLGHYLLAALYPEGLARWQQVVLGMAVVGVNLGWYMRLLRARAK